MIDHNNSTLTSSDSHGSHVLYWSLGGYGITLGYVIINIIITLAGFIVIGLNSFIVYILASKDRHWDASCIFIINLAISDTLCGVFNVYNVAYNLIHYKNIYECLFRFGLIQSVVAQASLSLFALTFDRYVKIISPHFYVRLFQEKYVKIYTLITWVLSIMGGLIPLFGWFNNSGFRHSSAYCLYFGVFSEDYLIMVWSFAFIIIFLICVMYIHILILAFSKIRQSSRIQHSLGKQGKRSDTSTMWWKPTKTVLVIVVLNIACLSPMGLYAIWILSDSSPKTGASEKGTVLVYLSPLVLLNSLANPVVYALKIPDIKLTFTNKCSYCLSKKEQHDKVVNTISYNIRANTTSQKNQSRGRIHPCRVQPEPINLIDNQSRVEGRVHVAQTEQNQWPGESHPCESPVIDNQVENCVKLTEPARNQSHGGIQACVIQPTPSPGSTPNH